MKYFLIGTTLLVSILLIVVVVAQESKQPGMGSAIGGG
ncbi:MAG: preprotein translocase subunit SecG, partial [Dialister sp.]